MIIKILHLLITYSLSIINFFILILPLTIISSASYILILNKYISLEVFSIALFKIIITIWFTLTLLMLIYLFFDFLFGFSVRSHLKNCQKPKKNYKFLINIFAEVKQKFNNHNAQLYIMKSNSINAFAIGSLRKKVIVLTEGILLHYNHHKSDNQEFITNIRSILGHEMAHLCNKDYLPGLITFINARIINLLNKIITTIFNLILKIFSYFSFLGGLINIILLFIYRATNLYIRIINKYFILNIYKIIHIFISKYIEFRCDKQSAQAFGGHSMANALEKLGNTGYFNIFSTHPSTKNRIKNVKNILASQKTVRVNFINKLTTYFTFILLVTACLFFAKYAEIDVFIRNLLN